MLLTEEEVTKEDLLRKLSKGKLARRNGNLLKIGELFMMEVGFNMIQNHLL